MKEFRRRLTRLGKILRWPSTVVTAIWLLAVPHASLAQPWAGGSTLGVQIRGSQGPVQGAVVEIRYRRPGLAAGPEARRTDSKGQANFVGIAAGRWSLEITHPEYLAFVASVNVEKGKKTDVVTQFLEASGPGRKTFKLKFLRSSQSLGTIVAGTASQEAEESRSIPTARTTPAPSPDAAKRLPSTASKPSLPPAPATPPAEAPPTPGLVAAPSASEPAAPHRVPEDSAGASSDVKPAPRAESPAQLPVPNAQPPAPKPAAPEAPPVAQPAEATPSTPPGSASSPQPPEELSSGRAAERLSDAPTSFRDRTCFECKPGEWAVSAEIEVPAGEPCRSTGAVAVRRAMRDVATAAGDELGDFAGALPTDLATLPLSLASTPARNTLAPYVEGSASCRFLAVVVPAGGRLTGFRLDAKDAQASGACTGEQVCEIGQARFLFSPALARTPGAAILYTVFENTGAEPRTATMTGFFLPPSGWAPE